MLNLAKWYSDVDGVLVGGISCSCFNSAGVAGVFVAGAVDFFLQCRRVRLSVLAEFVKAASSLLNEDVRDEVDGERLPRNDLLREPRSRTIRW